MTAQQVYDATMQVIAEKTTVRAPSEPTPAPYVATAEDKAQAASDKKAAAIRAQQDAIQHAKNVKAAKAFRNGDD